MKPLAGLALALAAAAAPAGGEPPVPGPDPFQPPPALQAKPAVRATGPGEPAPAPPRLRGTLAAGSGSLANLGGTVVGVGESVDGYRLLAVEEGAAVFLREGRRLRLSVDPTPRERAEDER